MNNIIARRAICVLSVVGAVSGLALGYRIGYRAGREHMARSMVRDPEYRFKLRKIFDECDADAGIPSFEELTKNIGD